MRFGVTVLTDGKGELFVYPGKGEVALPLVDIANQKELIKRAAVDGLKIGNKVFSSGVVVSQYGTESRKRFAHQKRAK